MHVVSARTLVGGQEMLCRLTGTIAICYGLALFIGACIPAVPWINTDWGVAVTFVVACSFFLPFVITYTKVGLNSAEGEIPSPETKRRHAELHRVVPGWKVAWYGFIAFVFFCWFVLPAFRLPINPFHGFTIGVSLLSGIWLRFVYPVARDLFFASDTVSQE
jgi:hypothetical protein